MREWASLKCLKDVVLSDPNTRQVIYGLKEVEDEATVKKIEKHLCFRRIEFYFNQWKLG